MMTFRFELAEIQDNDESLIFHAKYEDVNPAIKDTIEFIFSGDNMVFSPSHISLCDIQERGGYHIVLATPQTVGLVTAIMQINIDGKVLSSIRREFDLSPN